VVAVAVIGRLAAELSGLTDARRADAVALTVANPAVLLYLVSGAHLDAAMVALLLGALLAANQRRWTIAIVLLCLAAGIKPIALVALPALVVAHAVGQRGHVAGRILGRDVAAAAVTLLAATYAVGHDGLGWIRNVSETTHEHTFWAPANLISDLISPVVSGASYDDLAIGGRVAALLAAVTAVGYLLVTVLGRPLERTVGYLLLAIGVLSPTIYPWYLLWGVLCLASAATGLRRDWLIAISSAAAVLVLPGFTTREEQLITTAGLVVIVAGLVTRQYVRRQSLRQVTAPGATG
jgi:alpha-1,6-mannosyltransferase